MEAPHNSPFCAGLGLRPLFHWLRSGWVALSSGICPSSYSRAREQPLLSTEVGSVLSCGIQDGRRCVPFGDCRGDELHSALPTPISGSSGHEGHLGFCLQPDLGCERPGEENSVVTLHQRQHGQPLTGALQQLLSEGAAEMLRT